MMKRTLRTLLAWLLILSLALMCASCSVGDVPESEDTRDSQTDPQEQSSVTTSKRPTSKEFPEISVNYKYDYDPPVTGDAFDEWQGSYESVTVMHASCDGIEFYDNGNIESLYGDSHYDFVGRIDESCSVVLELRDGAAVSAYSIVTGIHEDGFQFPYCWTLYGSNLPPSDARKSDWVELDVVYESDILDAPATSYGYTVDEDKVDTYKFYKFEFWFGYWDVLDSIYFEELYLYTVPEK